MDRKWALSKGSEIKQVYEDAGFFFIYSWMKEYISHVTRGGLFKLRFIADHKYPPCDKMNVWSSSIS